jgi:predicted dehydrogenase
MSGAPFRLAICGAGKVAAAAHVPAALASREVTLAALVDPVAGRAETLASEYGIRPAIATRLADVLDRIDGVVIAAPNHAHCALALECFAAGMPALIEKPLATSHADGERILHAADAAGVTAAVGYNTRFTAWVELMDERLRARAFGAVRRFAYQTGSTGKWSPLSGYTLDRDAIGGGVVMVTGTHFLDRMLHWFGYPQRIEYRDDSRGGPEANACAIVGYDGEDGPIEGRLRFSKTVNLASGFVMETEAGTVVLPEGEHAELVLRPRTSPGVEAVLRRRDARPGPARKHYQQQLEDFVDAVRTKRPPRVPVRDGLASLRLIEAFYAVRRPLAVDWDEDATRARGAVG